MSEFQVSYETFFHTAIGNCDFTTRVGDSIYELKPIFYCVGKYDVVWDYLIAMLALCCKVEETSPISINWICKGTLHMAMQNFGSFHQIIMVNENRQILKQPLYQEKS